MNTHDSDAGDSCNEAAMPGSASDDGKSDEDEPVAEGPLAVKDESDT